MEYSTSKAAEIMGVSRATLRHYESAGVLHPQRSEGSGYRSYTHEDIYAFVSSMMLRNVGFSTGEGQEILAEEPPVGVLAACAERNRQEARRLAAIDKELEELCLLYGRDIQKPQLTWVEEMLFMPSIPNTTEGRYSPLNGDEVQGALVKSLPLTSFGGIAEGDFLAPGTPMKIGRVVSQRFLEFVSGLSGTPDGEWIGGCACVRLSFELKTATENLTLATVDGQREILRTYMQDHGFSACGSVFAARCLPFRDTFCYTVYVPVEGTTVWARRELKKLSRAQTVS